MNGVFQKHQMGLSILSEIKMPKTNYILYVVLFNYNTVKQGFTTFQPRDRLIDNVDMKKIGKKAVY